MPRERLPGHVRLHRCRSHEAIPPEPSEVRGDPPLMLAPAANLWFSQPVQPQSLTSCAVAGGRATEWPLSSSPTTSILVSATSARPARTVRCMPNTFTWHKRSHQTSTSLTASTARCVTAAQLVGGGPRAQFDYHDRTDQRRTRWVEGRDRSHAHRRSRNANRLGKSRCVHAPAGGTI